MKKGQVTIFIIIGIVILVILSVFIILNRESTMSGFESTTKVNSEMMNKVVVYAKECLTQSSQKAVYDFGIYGGDFKEKFAIENGFKFPVYDRLIKDDALIQSFKRDILIDFERCLLDYDFSEMGMNVLTGNEKSVDIALNDMDISVRANYMLKIYFQGKEEVVDSFVVNLPIPLKHHLESAREIANIASSTGDLTSHCFQFDPSGSTNVYVRGIGKYKLIKIIDYYPYYKAGMPAFIMQFAFENVELRGACYA